MEIEKFLLALIIITITVIVIVKGLVYFTRRGEIVWVTANEVVATGSCAFASLVVLIPVFIALAISFLVGLIPI